MTEVTHKSGISLTLAGTEGVDFDQEFFFHDSVITDRRVIYIKSATQISFAHNSTNQAGALNSSPYPGITDEGQIRYRIDCDLLQGRYWNDHKGATLWPAYSTPLTFAAVTYPNSVAVLGSTGDNGVAITSRETHYQYGQLDTFGDEWHTIAVGDDDEFGTVAPYNFNVDWLASDGKVWLFVVNPKTPCLNISATGDAKFYTTPPKAYQIPKVHAQTTYIEPHTGGLSFRIRDINGGNVFYRIVSDPGDAVTAYTAAGASSVTLTDADFATGTRYLQYYFNVANKKTRIVVKNPAFPSAGEEHGNLAWSNEDNADVIARILLPPNVTAYSTFKTSLAYHQRPTILSQYRNGLRTSIPGGSVANAMVAFVEGADAIPSGDTITYAEYARKALYQTSMLYSNIGMEQTWATNQLPDRLKNYRGYYDVSDPIGFIFTYDLLISFYRSDQETGGITPVEDYFFRDLIAAFVCAELQVASNIHGNYNSTRGMWDTARRLGAFCGMVCMEDYSTPYYGTSGIDGNTTTYTWAPYPNDLYTWKQILWDNDVAANGFPNLDLKFGVQEYQFLSDGTWKDRIPYYNRALMGGIFTLASNVAASRGLRWSYYDKSIELSLKGLMRGVKNPESYNTFACTGDSATGVITAAGNDFADGWNVYFPALTGGSSLAIDTPYFVRDKSGSTFKLALTSGGAAIALGSNITAGSISGPIYYIPNLPNYNGRFYDHVVDSIPHYLQATPAALATELLACGPLGVALYSHNLAPPDVTATPTPNYPAGAYESAISVELTSDTPGATVHYTTNGTTPTTGSPAYSTPIVVTVDTTIKALAAAVGLTNSPVMAAAYVVNATGKPNPPLNVRIS